jgi:ribosomal-protein-alanine N-acetyltransferase
VISLFGRRADFRLGRVETGHLTQCAALHARAFATGWSTTEFDRMRLDRNFLLDCALAASDGAVVGLMASRVIGDEGEILTLLVSERWRRYGVGRALARHQIDAAALAGARTIFLEVAESNEAAIKLYAKLGFEQIGRRNAYYPGPDGGRLSALTMKLVLD